MAMKNRTPPQCKNVSKLNQDEKLNLSKEIGLSFDLFDETLYSPIDFDKDFITRENVEGYNFYVMRYKKANPIIASQFLLHAAICKKVQSEILIPGVSYCLYDNQWNYLVYKSRDVSRMLYKRLIFQNLEKLNESLLNAVESFRIIEKAGGVFNNNQEIVPFYDTENHMLFRLKDLAALYPEKGHCYVKTLNVIEPEIPQTSEEVAFRNIIGEVFRLRDADKRMHRITLIFYLYLWVNISFRHRFFDEKEEVIVQFVVAILKLLNFSQENKSVIFNWKGINAFVRSWGQTGKLADLINGRRKERSSKNSLSRSSSSEDEYSSMSTASKTSS